MRAMVMPLWSCSYTVMLTSLRESFMGRGVRNGGEQEREITDTIQYQGNIALTSSLKGLYMYFMLSRCQTSPFKQKRVQSLIDEGLQFQSYL